MANAAYRDGFGNPFTDQAFNISAGAYENLKPENKFGWNGNLAATKITLASWLTSSYIYPGSAGLFGFASTSTNDIHGGAGAHAIEAFGCASGFGEISEVISLDGQNPVYTTLPWARINRAIVLDVGTSEINEGHIYCGVNDFTTGIPDSADNIYSRIDSGRGQTLQAIYTIPEKCNGYFTNIYFNIQSTKSTTIEWIAREQGKSFRIQELIEVNASGLVAYKPFRKFTEKTDIELRAIGANPAINIGAGFGLYLEKYT